MDKHHLKRKGLRGDIAGVTALEYGITASLLGLVLMSLFKGFSVILNGFGDTLSALFSHVGTAA